MTIGVYAVINKHTRKAYVGSSTNVERRLVHHKCAINTRNFYHYQGYAEDAMKYSVDDFEFKLLRETETKEEAAELEGAFLEMFIDDLYNKAPSANGASGIKRNSEVYVKGAAKRLQDPNYAKKLSEACKGKREVVTCPHCGLSGGGGNMRRYHFDKCDKK
jgi:predicted GIY-YIG superfamily endonuclease